MVTVSTVTPVYQGENYLAQLVEKLEEVRSSWAERYEDLKLIESIFVIDGAIDNSAAVLHELAKDRNWMRVIELSKNYGQHPATIAGILHSSGEWIITLDEDLQHNPIFIVKFLEEIVIKNSDICYAQSSEKTHNSFIKDKLAVFFKYIISKLSGVPFVVDFNSFRCIRGSIGRSAAAISSHEPYFDVVLWWFTDRVIKVSIPLKDFRNLGNGAESGYSVWSLIKHGKRMIMTSNIKILRLGLFIGIIAFGISILLAIYALYSTFYNLTPPTSQGWSSTILVILFFGGLLSLLVGFILESVSDLLLNAKGKPTFFTIDRSSDKALEKTLTKKLENIKK